MSLRVELVEAWVHGFPLLVGLTTLESPLILLGLADSPELKELGVELWPSPGRWVVEGHHQAFRREQARAGICTLTPTL